jgi:hypothetical protein
VANGNEMHIQYWKKNISILAKATQVSDVAHGPLVFIVRTPEDLGKNRSSASLCV